MFANCLFYDIIRAEGDIVMSDLTVLVLASPFIAVLIIVFSAMIRETYQSKRKAKKDRQYEQVPTISHKYQVLKQLTEENHVFQLSDPYEIDYLMNSKKALENANQKEMTIYLANNNEKVRNTYNQLTQNRENMASFHSAIEKAISVVTPESEIKASRIPSKDFYEIERILCDKLIDSVKDDVTIQINLLYYTPKHRYKYSRAITTNYQGLTEAYTEAAKREAKKTEAKMERAKLSDKLRYQVLLRDHRRCAICGRSAKDGAVLHIDHIKPVSKGGKTEINNLRVLCDRCNLGKGDSFNPRGFN